MWKIIAAFGSDPLIHMYTVCFETPSARPIAVQLYSTPAYAAASLSLWSNGRIRPLNLTYVPLIGKGFCRA